MSVSSFAHTWPIDCLINKSPTHFPLAFFHFEESLNQSMNTYFVPKRAESVTARINITDVKPESLLLVMV